MSGGGCGGVMRGRGGDVMRGRGGDVMRGRGGDGAGESDHVRGVLLTLHLLLRDENYQVSSYRIELTFDSPIAT